MSDGITKEEILRVDNLNVHYVSDEYTSKAVNGISLKLNKGETLGLVGETGAGKTTTAFSIMGLLPKRISEVISGSIDFDGQDILKLSEAEMRKIRGNRISMIYQDPMTSLNPTHTVGNQVAEVIKLHTKLSQAEVAKETDQLFELVGISKERKDDYPHQFSGGMKQRIIIAMALACNPEVLIADEPTTALDVTIQAQVLEMMNEIKSKLKSSVLFITHDFGVVTKMCDNVAIMYAGEIVEYGSVEDIFTNSMHPYTRGLLGSIPNLEKKTRRLTSIEGLMADSTDLPQGCKFHERCKECMDICKKQIPTKTKISDQHEIMCHLY